MALTDMYNKCGRCSRFAHAVVIVVGRCGSEFEHYMGHNPGLCVVDQARNSCDAVGHGVLRYGSGGGRAAIGHSYDRNVVGIGSVGRGRPCREHVVRPGY